MSSTLLVSVVGVGCQLPLSWVMVMGHDHDHRSRWMLELSLVLSFVVGNCQVNSSLTLSLNVGRPQLTLAVGLYCNMAANDNSGAPLCSFPFPVFA
jgi:hypothetical protein